MVNKPQRRSEQMLLADEDLMSLLGNVDKGALAMLYDRHSRVAHSLAYRMMGERKAEQDLVQEAFLRVWGVAGSYRVERGSVRTWMLSTAHHRGVDQLCSIASRRRAQDRAEVAIPTSQPSEAFAETWRNSQRVQVREALRALPPERLKVLELAYFSGYAHTEIAELLDLPRGTVKGHMSWVEEDSGDFDSRGMAVPG